MSGIDDLLRHELEVVTESLTGAPLATDGEDRGHRARTATVVGTFHGLIQPRTARERLSWNGVDTSIGTHRIYLEAAAIGQVDTDMVVVKAGGLDPDLDGTYKIGFVGNAAGWGHHLELDATRQDD